MNTLRKTASSLVLVAALAAAGCGGGGGSDTAYQTPAPTPPPTPTPTPSAESYTAWFKSVYPQAADSARQLFCVEPEGAMAA